MREAPFNITLVLLATYGASLIAGGVFAVILSSMGLSGFFGLFLAAFLAFLVGGFVRKKVASASAQQAGVSGDVPMAFSTPIRIVIGAVVAAVVAFVFSLSDFYSFGFMLGAVAALMTVMTASVAFYLNVSMGDTHKTKTKTDTNLVLYLVLQTVIASGIGWVFIVIALVSGHYSAFAIAAGVIVGLLASFPLAKLIHDRMVRQG